MAKIPLKLQEQDIAYCAGYFRERGMFEYFSISKTISNMMKKAIDNGTPYGPEDLIPFEIEKDDFLKLYMGIGMREEYLTSRIHKEIKDAILPQIMAVKNATPPTHSTETIQAAQEIWALILERELSSITWLARQRTMGRETLLL